MSIADIPNSLFNPKNLLVPLTGATTLSLDIQLQKINGLVYISWPSLSFTATVNNEVLLSIPLPAEYRPSVQQVRSVGCIVGATASFCDMIISTDGTVDFIRYGLNWSGACRLTSNTIVFNQ